MMQSNEYGSYDAYDYGVGSNMLSEPPEDDPLVMMTASQQEGRPMDVNFDDPKIANLPRVLLMGPRRGGKTSIQVRSVVSKEPIVEGSRQFRVVVDDDGRLQNLGRKDF